VYVVDHDSPGLSPELGVQSGRLRERVVGDVEATPAPVDGQSGRVAQPLVVRYNLAHLSQVGATVSSGGGVQLDQATTVDVEQQETAGVV